MQRSSEARHPGDIFVISSDCMRCGVCEFMCPVGAIVPAPNQFIVDKHLCDGCGTCVPFCVVSAIVPRARFNDRQDRTVRARLREVLDRD